MQGAEPQKPSTFLEKYKLKANSILEQRRPDDIRAAPPREHECLDSVDAPRAPML